MARAVVLVLDGVGAGELPDAADYGDGGSDTLGNLAEAAGGLRLPALQGLGLGNLHPILGVPPARAPRASWGRMAEASPGKDSTTGHWEMMGLPLSRPFPTFPGGFPREVVEELSARTGRGVICNRPASGTEIIEELGPRHMETGDLIVYTSADSVLQIAAHEEVVPRDELYAACLAAREIMQPPELGVARVIARPFVGREGAFTRTAGRRDYSLEPPGRTLLDALADAGVPRTGVGKIDDLFAHRSIETVHVPDNEAGIAELLRQMETVESGLVFANLVDFDMRWGHRNDTEGFRRGLEELDRALPDILSLQRPGEPLIITADHGNDPTTPSTDHSREHVPLLLHIPGRRGRGLGVRKTFSDVASTLEEHFGLDEGFPGVSLLGEAAG
jgi:phosphopentomutase